MSELQGEDEAFLAEMIRKKDALENRMVCFPSRGISVMPIMNLNTGKISMSFVVHKTSAKDNGMVLNFCPWCGGKLYDKQDFKEAKDE